MLRPDEQSKVPLVLILRVVGVRLRRAVLGAVATLGADRDPWLPPTVEALVGAEFPGFAPPRPTTMTAATDTRAAATTNSRARSNHLFYLAHLCGATN